MLHGREDEMAFLKAYVDRAAAGEQQLILVEGDPGIGKTTLLRAFAQVQVRRGRHAPRVFYLSAPADEVYQPVHHAALAATSRRLYVKLGGRRQATELARGMATDWLGLVPVWGDLLSAVAATVDALQRHRRQRAFQEIDTADEDVEALLAASRRRPLVLVLDDLERAGPEAVTRLEELICKADQGARILIVGAYRPTAPGIPDPPVHRLRQTLPLQGEFFLHFRLRGLDREDVAGWLEEQFRTGVPAALVDWLMDGTGGHPGALGEALAHLLERGLIRREHRGWVFETDPARLELPTVDGALTDLSAVSPEVAEVVAAATVVGDEFDAATLAVLLERDELAVEDQLALGVHFGLLENQGERLLPDGEVTTAYRFTGAHVRAALLRTLTPERRARLARRLRLPPSTLSAPEV